MKLEETDYKYSCDECDTYDYLFEIETQPENYHSIRLCKKCLLNLLKMIIER
jgi:hypothetical protein